jgi:hypothetical protein
MRQSYTPIFKKVLTSRVWALSDAHVRVWLWLQLQADPEGYVCADVTGVAVGARVSGQDARDALEVLGLPDADANPSDPHEGRLIERVPDGWLVLGVQGRRDLAKCEGQKARNRQYMQRQRVKAANDVEPVDLEYRAYLQGRAEGAAEAHEESTVHPLPSTVDAPKPISKSKPIEEERSPLPPIAPQVEPEEPAPMSRVLAPRVLHVIAATWQPSESLRADAAIAGVTDFDERLASLRSGPIGGARGVFEDSLEDYIRASFGKWRTWGEADRAKATAAASKPRAQGYRAPVIAIEPTARHREYAAKHGLPLDALVQELVDAGAADALGAKRALEMLGEKMGRMVRAQCDALIAKRDGAPS